MIAILSGTPLDAIAFWRLFETFPSGITRIPHFVRP
jgi:hypothetical protein